jgi:hypothetical protein
MFVASPVFEYFFVALVFASCFLLAMNAPYAEYAQTEEGKQMLENINITEGVFLGFFCIECLMYFIAMGPKAYFTSFEKVFELAIVLGCVIGVAMGPEGRKVNAIASALRAVRPLKALMIFPSVSSIVKCLAYAVVSLQSIVSIIAFFLVLFGLVAMQLFGTRMRYKCFYNDTLIDDPMFSDPLSLPDQMPLPGQKKPYDPYYFHCDPFGGGGQMCGDMFPGSDNQSTWPYDMLMNFTSVPVHLENYTWVRNGTIIPASEYTGPLEVVFEGNGTTIEYINATLLQPACESWPYGVSMGSYEANSARFVNGEVYFFADFTWTLVMIFQIISAVGWTDMMYMTQDSAGFWACFYFIAVLIAMQWVVLNIAVAVIADSYDSVMEEIEQKEKEKRIAQRKMLAEKARLAKLKKEKAKAAGKSVSTESLATTEEEPKKKGLAKIKDMLVLKPLTPEQSEKRAPITRLVKSRPFTYVFRTFIVTNAIILIIWTPYWPQESLEAFDVLNQVFSWLFVIEFLLKTAGLGAYEYFNDHFRILDFCVVVAFLIEVIGNASGWRKSVDLFFKGLAGFRILRLLRFGETIESFADTLKGTVRAFGSIGPITVVLVAYLFMVTILAMQLLGGVYAPNCRDDNVCGLPAHGNRLHFDDFVNALATIFYAMLTENWTGVMYGAFNAAYIGSTSDPPTWNTPPVIVVVFFMLFVITFGTYVILNMFLGILLSDGASDLEDAREERRVAVQIEEMKTDRAAKSLQRAVRFAQAQEPSGQGQV